MKLPRWTIEKDNIGSTIAIISNITGEVLFDSRGVKKYFASFDSWRESFMDKKSYVKHCEKLEAQL